MAFLGRESDADRLRAERFKDWLNRQSPYALPSSAMGALAVLDAVTIVIGATLGVIAIVLGVCGLADVRKRPKLAGRPMCVAGVALGGIAVLASAVWWVVLSNTG